MNIDGEYFNVVLPKEARIRLSKKFNGRIKFLVKAK